MRKAIRPITSRVSCFFTCEPYGKLKFSSRLVGAVSFRFVSPTIQSESCITEQKGGGKEFELWIQTPTKQP